MSSTPPGKKQTKEDGPRSKMESEAPGTQHVGAPACVCTNKPTRLQELSDSSVKDITSARGKRPKAGSERRHSSVSWSEQNRVALRVYLAPATCLL